MKKISLWKRLFWNSQRIYDFLTEEATKDDKVFESFQSQITMLQKELAVLNENTRESNKVAADELKKIAKVMTDKKARGRYGELQLEAILNDAFGEQTQIVKKQYKINGGLVDVALEVNGSLLIPIDAKFPKEYYDKWENAENASEREAFSKLLNSQVKEHAKKVSKYIDTSKTTNFALIFIPSEAIFAEIQRREELLDYAIKQKVFFVSPTSLLATVTIAAQIRDENYKLKNLPKIIKGLQVLSDHVKRYHVTWEQTQKHIEKAYTESQKHGRSVEKIEKKIGEITSTKDAKALIDFKEEE